MKRWPLLSVVLFALACPACAAPGGTVDPKSLDATAEQSAQAKGLVLQLNSASYRERESATRGLAKMGRLAVPALRAALATESSPEVQWRIDLVLPAAEAEDFKVRLACFQLDTEGRYEHRLAGWAKFKAVMGNDPSTRALFTEEVANETYRKLLLAADRPADELGAALVTHYDAIHNRKPFVYPTTAEIAALAFLESLHSDKAMPLAVPPSHPTADSYLHNKEIQAAMIPGREPGPHAAALRKILVRWLDSRETGTGLLQALSWSQTWRMPAATARYAAKLLAAGNLYGRSYGLERLGTHEDGAKYLPQIAKLIDDPAPLQPARPDEMKDDPHGVRLGDFALGVALLLSGQKHADYGLEVADANKYARVQPGNYYFQDGKDAKADDKRKAAIVTFRAWLAERPK